MRSRREQRYHMAAGVVRGYSACLFDEAAA